MIKEQVNNFIFFFIFMFNKQKKVLSKKKLKAMQKDRYVQKTSNNNRSILIKACIYDRYGT